MNIDPLHTSRRDLLLAAMSACGAMIAPAWLRAAAAEADARVAQVVATCIGIDIHNHVYPAGTEPQPHFGADSSRSPPGGASIGVQQPPEPALVLGDELKRSGLTAVCASYVLDFADNKMPDGARKNLLRWFAAIDEQLEKGHIRRALTLADLKAAHANSKPTIVQSVEGAQFIEGKLDRIEEVYRRGLRHLQLLHMSEDQVTPLGDMNADAPKFGGLTDFGAQVVRECNRLGILVDMAHASHETVLGALKVATQPLIISHTNLDTWTGRNARMAQMMKPRLISKEHAQAVAEAGGLVGVWTHLAGSPQEFVESVKSMVDAIGIDHVALGTDTDLLAARVGAGTNRAWPAMTKGFLPVAVEEMLRQGFGSPDIAKIAGENYCRVFGIVTARA